MGKNIRTNKLKKAVDKLPADVIGEMLMQFDYRGREIIKLRTGLGDGSVYTLSEIAYIFQTTREQISQIEQRCIRHIGEISE